MRGLGVLFFVLLLPVLAVLGHDFYATYEGGKINPDKAMMFSDIGYLWTKYEPETYKWAQQNVSADTWSTVVTPLLEQTSVVVAAIPPALVLILWLVIRFWSVIALITPTGRKIRASRSSFAFGEKDHAEKKVSYKRK